MKKIEEKVQKLFIKNMNFLKEYDNKLFERITSLNEIILDGTYTPRLDLEYTNDEFNIYDKKVAKYIYQNGPKAFSKYVKDTIDFKHVYGFNTLHEYAYSIVEDMEVTEDIIHIKNALSPYTTYINKNMPTNKKNKKFKYFKKVIVYGVLLGYHIDEIIKKYENKSLMLVEPNIEMFRLSLFVYDYEKLSKKVPLILFSISEDNLESFEAYEKFLNSIFTHNYFIKFFVSNNSYSEYLGHFAGMLQYNSPFNFDHMRMLKIVERTVGLISHGYKFLNLKSGNFELLQNKPVLILGAGPSLKYKIEWLEENKDRFIIVAAASSLPRLEKHNIKPDIITSLDAHGKKIYDQFNLKNKEWLDKTQILISSMTDFDTLKLLNKANISIYEVLSNIKYDSSVKSLTASNVGEITFAILLIMGIKNIYLLGVDAALDQITGASHDEVTFVGKIEKFNISEDVKIDEKRTKIDMDDVVETKGNLRDKVKTTRTFYNSVLGHGKLCELYKQEFQDIFNLSDGAYFKYTHSLDVKDFDVEKLPKIDKVKLSYELQKCFYQNSTNKLTSKERYNIRQQLLIISTLITAVEEFSKISDFKSTLEYEELRICVEQVLMESSIDNKSYLSKIFSTYFQLIENYINYFFNDLELKKVKKHMKNVHSIWCKEVIKLLNTYRGYLLNSIEVV